MSEPAAGWLSEEQQRVWRSYLLANAHINEYLETALRAFDLFPYTHHVEAVARFIRS